MKVTSRMNACVLGFFMMVVPNAFAYEGYEEVSSSSSSGENFYLSFSVGDGAYINYQCDHGGCDTAVYGPLNFEVLLGVKVGKFFYLDLAANWGVDYTRSSYNYSKITYQTGARPGIRIVFPGLFHKHLYLRGAVPIQYGINGEDNHWFMGLLLGIGVEWQFDNLGLFAEGDILPYFMEVYPGYYFIPVEGRLGVSFRF
jgi:hypothetical protein